MPDYYVVPALALTATADAIREKTGSSEEIEFTTDGFKDAVDAIGTGGGYSADNIAMCDGGSSKNVVITGTTIKAYAFYGWNITSLVGDSVTTVGAGAFQKCTSLGSISLANCALNNTSANYAFGECSALNNIFLPKWKQGGQYCFQKAGKSTGAIVLPAATGIAAYYFSNAYAGAIDIGPNVSSLGNRSLEKMPNITALILRRTASVVTIPSIQSVEGSRFASGKAGAMLYVPSALIPDYEAATNWSTILGYENNQILPIEGSIYETQYADGTPIE